MCISSNKYSERNYKIDFTKLEYSKTPEQKREEMLMAATARCYLESLGIQVSTKYGHYRDTYDIMKDFGKWLSENNKYTLPANYFAGKVVEQTNKED